MKSLHSLIQKRGKNMPKGFAYQIGEDKGKFGMDVVMAGSPRIDESRMAAFIPYADGNARDGVGDLLEISGIDHTRHQQNPIVLYDHGKEVTLPVGTSEDPSTGAYLIESDPVAKTEGGWCFFYQGKGFGTMFPSNGETGRAKGDNYDHALFCEQLFDLMAKKLIRGGSLGYTITEGQEIPPDYFRGTPQGLHLKRVKMLEFSAVVLPCNQDTVAKSLSLDKHILGMRDTARQILSLRGVRGKRLSPYLIKSLSPWVTVETPEGKWVYYNKNLNNLRNKYKAVEGSGDSQQVRVNLLPGMNVDETNRELGRHADLGRASADWVHQRHGPVTAQDKIDTSGMGDHTSRETRAQAQGYNRRIDQLIAQHSAGESQIKAVGFGGEEAPKEPIGARHLRQYGIDKIGADQAIEALEHDLGGKFREPGAVVPEGAPPTVRDLIQEIAEQDMASGKPHLQNYRNRNSSYQPSMPARSRAQRMRYDNFMDELQAGLDEVEGTDAQGKANGDPEPHYVPQGRTRGSVGNQIWANGSQIAVAPNRTLVPSTQPAEFGPRPTGTEEEQEGTEDPGEGERSEYYEPKHSSTKAVDIGGEELPEGTPDSRHKEEYGFGKIEGDWEDQNTRETADVNREVIPQARYQDENHPQGQWLMPPGPTSDLYRFRRRAYNEHADAGPGGRKPTSQEEDPEFETEGKAITKPGWEAYYDKVTVDNEVHAIEESARQDAERMFAHEPAFRIGEPADFQKRNRDGVWIVAFDAHMDHLNSQAQGKAVQPMTPDEEAQGRQGPMQRTKLPKNNYEIGRAVGGLGSADARIHGGFSEESAHGDDVDPQLQASRQGFNEALDERARTRGKSIDKDKADALDGYAQAYHDGGYKKRDLNIFEMPQENLQGTIPEGMTAEEYVYYLQQRERHRSGGDLHNAPKGSGGRVHYNMTPPGGGGSKAVPRHQMTAAQMAADYGVDERDLQEQGKRKLNKLRTAARQEFDQNQRSTIDRQRNTRHRHITERMRERGGQEAVDEWNQKTPAGQRVAGMLYDAHADSLDPTNLPPVEPQAPSHSQMRERGDVQKGKAISGNKENIPEPGLTPEQMEFDDSNARGVAQLFADRGLSPPRQFAEQELNDTGVEPRVRHYRQRLNVYGQRHMGPPGAPEGKAQDDSTLGSMPYPPKKAPQPQDPPSTSGDEQHTQHGIDKVGLMQLQAEDPGRYNRLRAWARMDGYDAGVPTSVRYGYRFRDRTGGHQVTPWDRAYALLHDHFADEMMRSSQAQKKHLSRGKSNGTTPQEEEETEDYTYDPELAVRTDHDRINWHANNIFRMHRSSGDVYDDQTIAHYAHGFYPWDTHAQRFIDSYTRMRDSWVNSQQSQTQGKGIGSEDKPRKPRRGANLNVDAEAQNFPRSRVRVNYPLRVGAIVGVPGEPTDYYMANEILKDDSGQGYMGIKAQGLGGEELPENPVARDMAERGVTKMDLDQATQSALESAVPEHRDTYAQHYVNARRDRHVRNQGAAELAGREYHPDTMQTKPKQKSLSNIRQKYRPTVALRKRLKKSTPGAAMINVHETNGKAFIEACGSMGVKVMCKDNQSPRMKFKVIGDDSAIDELARKYAMPRGC